MIDIKTGVRYFTYDEFDHLTRFTDGSTTITYTYYPDGTRASRQVSGANEVKYVYDREDIMVEYEHISGTDTYTRRYTHGPGIDNPAKLHLEQGATDKDFAYHLDALGSVRLLSDSSKTTAGSWTLFDYVRNAADQVAGGNAYENAAEFWDDHCANYYSCKHYAEAGAPAGCSQYRFPWEDGIAFDDLLDWSWPGEQPVSTWGWCPNHPDTQW